MADIPLHDYYIIQLLIALFLKHFICDFLLQTSEMAESKGIYGYHLGVKHSLHHGIGTFIVSICFVSPMLSLLVALIDGIIHYHIDWFKVKFGPNSYKDKHYWAWFGADQFLHYMTIILIFIIMEISGETIDFKF